MSHLGYSKQLFLVRLEEVDLTGLSTFYSSVLEGWQGLEYNRDAGASPGIWQKFRNRPSSVLDEAA